MIFKILLITLTLTTVVLLFPACWNLYNLTKSQKSEQAIQIKPLGSNHMGFCWKGICNPISCLTCEGANRRQTSVIRDLSRNSSAAFRSFSGFSKTRNRVYKIAFKIQSLFCNINQKYCTIHYRYMKFNIQCGDTCIFRYMYSKSNSNSSKN